MKDCNKISNYQGIIDQTIKFIEEFQLLRTDLWCRFVQQFQQDSDYDAGWRGEYWGKMMRGACFVYQYSQNPELYQLLEETVSDILSVQDEQGRISSYGINHEFDAWDIWGRKYVLLGMQYFLEICKDAELVAKIVDSMCRQVDYIMSKIGRQIDGKIVITKATRHWRGLNSSSILEPIVKLYNITKEQKYLDFATYIVEQGGMDVANIFELAYEDKFYPYQYPVTKAYEMTSCFEGLLEYYHVVGNERHKISVINFANKILESDFTIIGCCGCTHEFFDHSSVRQANTSNGVTMQETCVTVTLMKFFYHLTLLTRDTKFVDAFETSLYNAYLGSVNTEKVIETTILKAHQDWNIEPLPFDSYSPLTAGTRGNGIGGLKVMSDNHYYGCCACIGAAGIDSYDYSLGKATVDFSLIEGLDASDIKSISHEDGISISYTVNENVVTISDDSILNADKTTATGATTTVVMTTELAKYILPLRVVTLAIRTTDDFYSLSTYYDQTSQKVEGYFVLCNDLDFAGLAAFTPFCGANYLGSSNTVYAYGWCATFDGQNHVIKNLAMAKAQKPGIFGNIAGSGVVKNIAFTGVVNNGYGGYVCDGIAGTVENVYVEGICTQTNYTTAAQLWGAGALFARDLYKTATISNITVVATGTWATHNKALATSGTEMDGTAVVIGLPENQILGSYTTIADIQAANANIKAYAKVADAAQANLTANGSATFTTEDNSYVILWNGVEVYRSSIN